MLSCDTRHPSLRGNTVIRQHANVDGSVMTPECKQEVGLSIL